MPGTFFIPPLCHAQVHVDRRMRAGGPVERAVRQVQLNRLPGGSPRSLIGCGGWCSGEGHILRAGYSSFMPIPRVEGSTRALYGHLPKRASFVSQLSTKSVPSNRDAGTLLGIPRGGVVSMTCRRKV